MGEAARQDFNDSGVRVSLIEPGMTDTPFFDSPPEHRGAAARRHRPRGHVRRAAAAARRRQRDPDPADRAAELVLVGSAFASATWTASTPRPPSSDRAAGGRASDAIVRRRAVTDRHAALFGAVALEADRRRQHERQPEPHSSCHSVRIAAGAARATPRPRVRARPRSCGRGGRVELHDAGALAKIVWSLPMPTPAPGWNTVPRWRTMISPPVTVWPANTFTPRHLGLESRPLRLEPSPFL